MNNLEAVTRAVPQKSVSSQKIHVKTPVPGSERKKWNSGRGL